MVPLWRLLAGCHFGGVGLARGASAAAKLIDDLMLSYSYRLAKNKNPIGQNIFLGDPIAYNNRMILYACIGQYIYYTGCVKIQSDSIYESIIA